MQTISGSTGSTISYRVEGSGPPLVLVHGAFSDHDTNWMFVAPALARHFTLYAIARRGRGRTDATSGHTLEDEARDVADVIRAIGEPVFLLGHSYGAHCALLAAAAEPARVRKLIVYEAPKPSLLRGEALAALEAFAAAGDWDQLAYRFFADTLQVPTSELDPLRASDLWPPIVADAPASLGDLRAIHAYKFDPARIAHLAMPVLLQIGSESPREFYLTDTIAATLPQAGIGVLSGQAHEGMTTAPEIYADAVTRFLRAGTVSGHTVASAAGHA